MIFLKHQLGSYISCDVRLERRGSFPIAMHPIQKKTTYLKLSTSKSVSWPRKTSTVQKHPQHNERPSYFFRISCYSNSLLFRCYCWWWKKSNIYQMLLHFFFSLSKHQSSRLMRSKVSSIVVNGSTVGPPRVFKALVICSFLEMQVFIRSQSIMFCFRCFLAPLPNF